MRAGGNSKEVGDVRCRKVVHLIVEENSSPERRLYVEVRVLNEVTFMGNDKEGN